MLYFPRKNNFRSYGSFAVLLGRGPCEGGRGGMTERKERRDIKRAGNGERERYLSLDVSPPENIKPHRERYT